MSSNDLVNVMREFRLEVHMLEPLDDPDPSGPAIGAMLMEIHRLRAENARLTSELEKDRARSERLQEALRIAVMVVERAYGKDPRPDGNLLEDWGLDDDDLADDQPGDD